MSVMTGPPAPSFPELLVSAVIMSAGGVGRVAGAHSAVTACEKLSEPFGVDEAASTRSLFFYFEIF